MTDWTCKVQHNHPIPISNVKHHLNKHPTHNHCHQSNPQNRHPFRGSTIIPRLTRARPGPRPRRRAGRRLTQTRRRGSIQLAPAKHILVASILLDAVQQVAHALPLRETVQAAPVVVFGHGCRGAAFVHYGGVVPCCGEGACHVLYGENPAVACAG